MVDRTVPLAALLVAGILTLPLFFSSLTRGAAMDDDPARIEATREGDVLRLRGLFEAADPPAVELTYHLDVKKRGASGTSTSRQGGTFTPSAGRTDTLSTVQIGVQPGDTVVARLEVSGLAGPVAGAEFRDTIR